MESLMQSLGWGSGGGKGGYQTPGLKAGGTGGYFPASVSLLAGDSDDEVEGEGGSACKSNNSKEDESLNLQLAKLDKSYQKFTLKNKQ